MVALVAVAVAGVAAWAVRRSAPAPNVVAEAPVDRVWIVDAGFATQYSPVVRAIADAGGDVRAFDFPGATLANGDRYVWARDYGPLETPAAAGAVLWDARNGGTTSPALENEALQRLAVRLGVGYRVIDLAVQGGNWLLLPDGRVITTSRFLEDNRGLGERREIEARLQQLGVRGLIEISSMPGELTRHADMVLAVDPIRGRVFVAEVWPEAIDRVPSDQGWDMYRKLATAMRDSLERTARELRSELGDDRVFRFPQPLPRLDRHATEDRYRPTFPSFVNGIFVTAEKGATTYLYGLSRDSGGADHHSFDAALVDAYVAEVERVALALGFTARGVETGDLVRNGGSLHCATVQSPFVRSRAASAVTGGARGADGSPAATPRRPDRPLRRDPSRGLPPEAMLRFPR